MHENYYIMMEIEIIDAYVQQIWQDTEILNSGEQEIFEVFSNSLPPWLYWMLFPNDDLHVAVGHGGEDPYQRNIW